MSLRRPLACLALLWLLASPRAGYGDALPAVFRIGTFSLSSAEARQLEDVLYRHWLPVWLTSGTMEIRVTADPGLDRAVVGYGSGEERFELLEVHPVPFMERWPRPEERPLAPFLEWSAQSQRWPAVRREALVLARKDSPPLDTARPGGFTLALVSRHSWLGGQLQLRMLETVGRVPTLRLDLGTMQDALRALEIGWADLAAVPRDPDFKWGFPFDLSNRFAIYQQSPAQPPPIWVLSVDWGQAHPAGKAWLREVLPRCFEPKDLVPVVTWGREWPRASRGAEGVGP